MLVSGLVLAALTASTGSLSDQALVRLHETVDAHWRGAYDILVRPKGSRLDLEATANLVEPNFVAFSGSGGISLDQLDQIRNLPGVSLAAPIAVVGYLGYSFAAPIVFTSVLPDHPTLYQITVTATTSDGIHDVAIGSSTNRLLLGPYDLAKPGAPFVTDASYFEYAEDGLKVAMPVLPTLESPLVAVDPAAEAELLGSSGAPFASLANGSSAAWTVGTFDRSKIPNQFEDSKTALLILSSTHDPTVESRPVLPIIVADRLYAPLTLRLAISRIGDELKAYPKPGSTLDELNAAQLDAGAGTTFIGDVSLDATSVLRPFSAPALVLEWPGSGHPSGVPFGVGNTQALSGTLFTRPTYTNIASLPSTPGVLTFAVQPLGTTGLQGAGGGGRTLERAYREPHKYDLALGSGFVSQNPYDKPFLFAPLGEFSLDDLRLPDDPVSYVPMGMYDEPSSELTARADGTIVTPRAFSPTFNPAGVLTVPPLAFTDLASGALLKGDAPIDAIRVRVGGLSGFDQASQDRVTAVAGQISELGLDVDIVAGSSPQSVSVFVPDYVVGTPSTDLGYVKQEWTTLGAAQSVDRGMSDLNLALLQLALLAAVILTLGLVLLDFAVRAGEGEIQRAIGWSAGDIVRWLVGETAFASFVILLAGFSAWISLHGGVTALIVMLVIALLLPAATALLAISIVRRLGSSALTGDLWTPRWVRMIRVRGTLGLAMRLTFAYPARSLVTAAATAVAATAIALGAIVLLGAAARGGPTLLGSVVVSTLLPTQAALVIASAIAGAAVLASLTTRTRREFARDGVVLEAIGWTPSSIERVAVARDVVIGLVGAAGAAAFSAVLARTLGVPSVDGAIMGASAGASLSTLVAITVFASNRMRLFATRRAMYA
ncbi:MAG TPA: hypothetical protein VJ850_08160 [Candidatus Limnocylindrales bacterium]|nr:hypothetical protein [Candidatus Limnocylindrales bacterium]